MYENDRLVSIFEAARELRISLFRFLTLVDIKLIVSLQSFKFGVNLFLPHSEVLKIKQMNF